MKPLMICFLLVVPLLVNAQDEEYKKEMKDYRKEQNDAFKDPDKSPLTPKKRKKFKGHDFFPVDEKYRLEARFEPTPDSKPFYIPTSRGNDRLYKRIGVLHFELKGEAYTLEAYLQVQSFAMKSAIEYVFLPIIDETTGESTYGAGRYLHYEGIPEGDTWILDFNKLYNPYCAYSDRYDCPFVPEPNHLPIKIEAGVRGY